MATNTDCTITHSNLDVASRQSLKDGRATLVMSARNTPNSSLSSDYLKPPSPSLPLPTSSPSPPSVHRIPPIATTNVVVLNGDTDEGPISIKSLRSSSLDMGHINHHTKGGPEQDEYQTCKLINAISTKLHVYPHTLSKYIACLSMSLNVCYSGNIYLCIFLL